MKYLVITSSEQFLTGLACFGFGFLLALILCLLTLGWEDSNLCLPSSGELITITYYGDKEFVLISGEEPIEK